MLCGGCFVLIVVSVLAMTLLPGIPGVSGLVVVSQSTYGVYPAHYVLVSDEPRLYVEEP